MVKRRMGTVKRSTMVMATATVTVTAMTNPVGLAINMDLASVPAIAIDRGRASNMRRGRATTGSCNI